MLRYIFIAKGIGILLVLLFHFGPSTWWTELYTDLGKVVYKHHMPLFMCLSGFLFRFKQLESLTFSQNYREHLRKKSLRILLPYLTISLCYAAMKIAGQGFLSSHRPVDWSVLTNTLIDPGAGLASLLWFLYVLFVYVSLTPLLQQIFKNPVLTLLAVAISFVPSQTDIVLRLCRFYPMFMIGILLRDYRVLDSINCKLAMTLSAAVFCITCYIDPEPFLVTTPTLALLGGLSGTMFWLSLSKWLDETNVLLGTFKPVVSLLDYLGKHSMAIYLLHQPFVWLAPVILHTRFGWDAAMTLRVLPISMALGLTVPLLVEKFLLNRSAWVSLFVLGVSGEKPAKNKINRLDASPGLINVA